MTVIHFFACFQEYWKEATLANFTHTGIAISVVFHGVVNEADEKIDEMTILSKKYFNPEST